MYMNVYINMYINMYYTSVFNINNKLILKHKKSM